MPCSPLEFSKLERLALRRAPLLAEHPDEVLADVLTLSDAEIGRLQDEEVAAAPYAGGGLTVATRYVYELRRGLP